MRKCLVTLVAVLCSLSLYANPVEKTEILSSKVVLQNSCGYFHLSDGSLWKIVPFLKRWRSLSEWWNNTQLIPPNYECLPKDWFVGAEIQVFPKYGNLVVNEADASNQDDIKPCTHLLVNVNNGQVLFAIALNPSECLTRLFGDARKEGYDEGFNEGRFASHKDSRAAYDEGYSEGYRVGYKEGIQAFPQRDQ